MSMFFLPTFCDIENLTDFYSALLFCRTKLDCDNLEKYLRKVGGEKYSCVCLHGDRKPQERKANLEKFKAKQCKFLICTDVAARGLDITGLPFSKFRFRRNPNNYFYLFLVVNYTLPDEKSNYVHRIGRVGRAERMGLAISLVSTVPEKVMKYLWVYFPIAITFFFFCRRFGIMVNGVLRGVKIVGIPD